MIKFKTIHQQRLDRGRDICVMDPDAACKIDGELACDFMWHASDNHFHILN